jgi:ribosomal protein S12 methylthiotransferase accessory factor
MIIRMQGKAQVIAEYHGIEIPTDQRPEAGGDGSAPEPFTLFLAAIGTCAGIYVMKFCQTRGIPTDGILIRERILPDPANAGRVGRVELMIEVPPEFPEKYHEALVRAADGCAVKKAIQNPFEISVSTVIRG